MVKAKQFFGMNISIVSGGPAAVVSNPTSNIPTKPRVKLNAITKLNIRRPVVLISNFSSAVGAPGACCLKNTGTEYVAPGGAR